MRWGNALAAAIRRTLLSTIEPSYADLVRETTTKAAPVTSPANFLHAELESGLSFGLQY
jgi:hypothetical protein